MEIKRKVSFQEYSEGIEKLAIMISDSGFMPSHIISIARGGLRVGDILSRLFRVRSSYKVMKLQKKARYLIDNKMK